MDLQFTRECDRAIFTYATALELGFRFATFATDSGRGKRLWFSWPPTLSPVVLGPMRVAIEKNLPLIIALVEEGCGCEEGAKENPRH